MMIMYLKDKNENYSIIVFFKKTFIKKQANGK